MKKYFGTDGIRNVANTGLTPELVYKVAKAGAYVLTKKTGKVPTILIGKDTRISGGLLETAMCAGFLSYGANVKLLGVAPTPAVAYLTKKLNADAGVVISASHNSFEDNGIKFFSNKGMKIDDEIEIEIEEIIDNPEKMEELTAFGDKVGTYENEEGLVTEYVSMLEESFGEVIKTNNTSDFKVAVDAANGAGYKAAEEIFTALGIKYEIINNTPDGININENCGSTHLEGLKDYVVKNGMSLGVAYDGDADRCLAVDEKGNTIDGDYMLAIFSNYLKGKGKLAKDTVVATVMSNLGLNKLAEEKGLVLKQTKVGDRYVLEEMLKGGYNLGGEQSGHVLLLDYNPTGDGILTSLMLIQILLESKVKASELCGVMKVFPQVLVNARIKNENKNVWDQNEKITSAIAELEAEMAGSGRVLIRTSGTEPLVRVMVEGEDLDHITKRANEVAEVIKSELS